MTRQVLAEPETGLAEKTWARLADGTPLVTAERRGKGLIVLFHVTADTTWSNLPLSGLFVDMLRRIVAEADAPGQGAAKAKVGEHGDGPAALAHAERLRRSRAAAGARPNRSAMIFPASATRSIRRASTDRAESLRAVNALAHGAGARRGPTMARSTVHEGALAIAPPIDLRRWLLPAALIGLMIDALVSIWLMGGAPLRRRGALAALAVAAALGLAAVPHQARAAEAAPVSDRDMDAALSARLAYVVTGDATVDETSKLGLTALTRVLAARTSAELAEPVAARSGARRTRLLSADLLADRRRLAAAASRRRARASPPS